MTRTLEEIWFEVDIKQVTTETLNGVVEGQNVYAFAVFDIEALVNVNEIPKFDSEVVSGDLVDLDLALFNTIVTQTNKNSISPLLATMIFVIVSNVACKTKDKTYRTIIVSPRKRPRVSIVAGFRVAT